MGLGQSWAPAPACKLSLGLASATPEVQAGVHVPGGLGWGGGSGENGSVVKPVDTSLTSLGSDLDPAVFQVIHLVLSVACAFCFVLVLR